MTQVSTRQYRQYAPDIDGVDQNYRTIECGDGTFRSGGFGITGFIRPSDAALMASAPKLLEALEQAEDALTYISNHVTNEHQLPATLRHIRQVLYEVQSEMRG